MRSRTEKVCPMTTAAIRLEQRSALLARALPFAFYLVFMAATPFLATALPGLDSRWLYALRIGPAILALAWFTREYSELHIDAALTPRQWLGAAAVGLAVFMLWINLDLPWMKVGAGGTAGFDPRDGAGALAWPLVLMRIAGAALVVPVIEELFWRSLVMRWMDNPQFTRLLPAAVSLRALLLSSIVFGLEHHLWFAGIIAGLAYGWLYMRSGNLWPPILAHGITNLLLGIWVVTTGNWQFW